MHLFKLISEYFKDRCFYRKNVDIFRPGKVFNLIVYIPCLLIFFIVLLGNVIDSLKSNNNIILFSNGDIQLLIPLFVLYIFMYLILLSPYIIIKDGNIEYVQYFIIRKKIPLNDIKSCEYETKNAGLAISIIGSNTKISFSTEFCDKKNMLKLFERIGYLDFYDRNLAFSNIKNNYLMDEDFEKQNGCSVLKRKMLCLLMSFFLVVNISLIFAIIIFLNGIRLNALGFPLGMIILVFGFSFSNFIETKTKKLKTKILFALTLIFIILAIALLIFGLLLLR